MNKSSIGICLLNFRSVLEAYRHSGIVVSFVRPSELLCGGFPESATSSYDDPDEFGDGRVQSQSNSDWASATSNYDVTDVCLRIHHHSLKGYSHIPDNRCKCSPNLSTSEQVNWLSLHDRACCLNLRDDCDSTRPLRQDAIDGCRPNHSESSVGRCGRGIQVWIGNVEDVHDDEERKKDIDNAEDFCFYLQLLPFTLEYSLSARFGREYEGVDNSSILNHVQIRKRVFQVREARS